MKIEKAIQQKKFESEYQKATINVLYTASWMTQQSANVLKCYNISWQQFNIMRILKGMHPKPASVKLLTERMIDKMSNASRLVEKLKQKGYVDRTPCDEDRRKVNIQLTDLGLDVLEKASIAMRNDMEKKQGKVSEEETILLNQLLDKLRG